MTNDNRLPGRPRGRAARPALPTDRVEAAIRAKGSHGWSADELGKELGGYCRQTIYFHIKRLRERGHLIEGCPYHGFMARMMGEAA